MPLRVPPTVGQERGSRSSGLVFSIRTSFSFALAIASLGLAATPLEAQVGSAPTDGEVEFLFLDDPSDFWSSGSIVLSGQTVIIPRNLLIDLPANRLTLWQLFQQAPPECLALGESGLALTDGCVRGRGGAMGHAIANQLPDGTFVAGELTIQKGTEVLTGVITRIDHTDGYMVVNGDPEDALNTGTMVRINDPEGVQTIQQGLGCDGGPNCSPDPRFTNDPSNYTITFMTGYPACIPSTVTGGNRTTGAAPDGTGDPFCPATNRLGLLAQDSRFMAPIQLGDHIAAEGNTEVILDRVTGQEISFLSAHTLTVSRAIHTLDDPSQPDYMTFDEVEWDAPGFNNERSKSLFIAFTTLPQSEFHVFALDIDPTTGESFERILASTINNPLTQNQGIGPGGRNIGKVGFDVDFPTGAPVNPRRSPCTNLQTAGFAVCPNGNTLEEEFEIVSPLTREVIGRTRHKELLDPGVLSFDIRGNESQNGEYLTPIGVGHPEFGEINLDGLTTPFIFTGENWNLDRRLGPGGCNEVCDDLSTAPIGSLRLDPFPVSALDALSQTPFAPQNIARVYHYYPFEGQSVQAPAEALTLLNYGVTPGWQRGPDLPALCSSLNSAPVAGNDTLTTTVNTPLLISAATLLANDTDLEFDLLTVTAVGSPTAQGGTVTSNGGGTWTYVPPGGFTGTDLFTYLLADPHGGSASGTITVTVTP